MVKIGNKELVLYTTTLVPQNTDVRMQFQLNDWNVDLKIRLVDDGGESGISLMTNPSNAEQAIMEIRNFNNSLGTSLKEPVEFGTSNGIVFYYLLAIYKIGTTTKLEMEFLKEANDAANH